MGEYNSALDITSCIAWGNIASNIPLGEGLAAFLGALFAFCFAFSMQFYKGKITELTRINFCQIKLFDGIGCAFTMYLQHVDRNIDDYNIRKDPLKYYENLDGVTINFRHFLQLLPEINVGSIDLKNVDFVVLHTHKELLLHLSELNRISAEISRVVKMRNQLIAPLAGKEQPDVSNRLRFQLHSFDIALCRYFAFYIQLALQVSVLVRKVGEDRIPKLIRRKKLLNSYQVKPAFKIKFDTFLRVYAGEEFDNPEEPTIKETKVIRRS